MAWAEAQLDGVNNNTVLISVDLVSQSADNYSTYYVAISLTNPNGNTTWSNYTQYWSANFGGYAVSGTFTFDFRNGAKSLLIWNGYINRWHDAAGYPRGEPFYSVGSIDTNHASIGDGSVGLYFSGTPRIPKVPDAPTMLAPDQITANSLRSRFSGHGDGGSPITSWGLQYATNPEFTGATLIGSNGTNVLTGLMPATTYYLRARGANAVGNGPWSSAVSALTLSAAKISDDAAFENVDVLISKAGAWVPAQAMISKAGAWVSTG